MIEALALELLALCHRGGKFAYYWNLESKLSIWWEVGHPVAIPSTWKNVYFGVHPTEAKGANDERSKVVTVSVVNCLFGEWDTKDFADKETCREHIKKLPLSPTCLIDSGGG